MRKKETLIFKFFVDFKKLLQGVWNNRMYHWKMDNIIQIDLVFNVVHVLYCRCIHPECFAVRLRSQSKDGQKVFVCIDSRFLSEGAPRTVCNTQKASKMWKICREWMNRYTSRLKLPCYVKWILVGNDWRFKIWVQYYSTCNSYYF